MGGVGVKSKIKAFVCFCTVDSRFIIHVFTMCIGIVIAQFDLHSSPSELVQMCLGGGKPS